MHTSLRCLLWFPWSRAQGCQLMKTSCQGSLCPQMRIKKDFELWADVRGRPVNFMQGLELYEGLLSPQEQTQMIQHCLQWKEAGHQVRPLLPARPQMAGTMVL